MFDLIAGAHALLVDADQHEHEAVYYGHDEFADADVFRFHKAFVRLRQRGLTHVDDAGQQYKVAA